MPDIETSKLNSEVSKSNSNILVINNFFLKNDVTSEGAVSHNVLYHQHFSISPLMLATILSNYQWYPVPLTMNFIHSVLFKIKTGSTNFNNVVLQGKNIDTNCTEKKT